MSATFSVDRARWNRLSILEQMGNIGSEVGRSFAASKHGDDKATQAAITRALDLFDATTENELIKAPNRLKEILRARDQYLSYFYDDSAHVDPVATEQYFTQFAVAARIHR